MIRDVMDSEFPKLKEHIDYVIEYDGKHKVKWLDGIKATKTQIKEANDKYVEKKSKRDEFTRVKQCYLDNPNDISRPERIEFSEYFTFADNDLFYPLEEYPLIVAQIEEWKLNKKL